MTSNSSHSETLHLEPHWSPDTVTVQAGRPFRVAGAGMNPAIVPSSTYIHDTERGYGREGNDGWAAFEAAIGALDGGAATAFSSGLAAATAIADLVPTGGVVVMPRSAYYGVTNIFARLETHGRFTVRTVEGDDTEAVLAAAEGADMVWLEAVANPTMAVADVPAVAPAAKQLGSVVVVDATFPTPLRMRPLEMGADIVLHSATKLIGGHSDLLMGVATCKSEEHREFIALHRKEFGATPGGLEAFLALRGLRTLSIRLEKAQSNALELARRLSAHPLVTKVNYPGLEGDSQYERAQVVLPDGSGNMLSFELDGTPEQTDEILASLRLFSHATSLGGVESKIERRARYEGERAAGVPATLCRVSVGIENVEDIWTDLETAFKGVLD